MIKIGMMLGERYEILEKIGTGGMSDVYKAKCHKLNRYVAVKVLKQEFSENSNFVSKFRVEAQAAASLMHPNIVNVYDVGEDNGIHFIVMELVEGITLKKYIEKKARLSVKEAVSIAIQACMGIEAAHNNHIIHRDIKPQNIIISKEGKVKVTDFGIAKAATSNTITSNVMGSVHYTSPEQARGGYSDEKSDIYSMGITLFEMLTGRVPFNGDTTVAIAIKHIQEPMPSPRDYVPEIPVSVEQIVLKCTQKSPDRRYQSMNSLIEDLKKSLISPDEDFVRTVDPEATAATRTISRDDMEQIKKQSKKPSHTEEIRLKKNTAKPAAPPSRSGKKRAQAVYQPEPEDDEEEEEYESRMEKVTTVLAVIGAIIIGCVVIFLVGRAIGIFDFSSSGEDGTVKMIEVAGMTEAEARQKLTKMGLEPSVEYVESDSVEEGLVIDSDVKKGTQLKTGSKVVLRVSGKDAGITVPDTYNKPLAEAVAALEGEGFLTEKKEGYSDTVPKGNVMTQKPEGGTNAERGSTVTITISQGPQESKVQVPDVMGLLPDEGKSMIESAGLTVRNISEVYNEDESLLGKICGLSYSVGTEVDPGTSIDVYVSKGPEATYTYAENIASPALEDPQYVEGTPCVLVVTTASGTEIARTVATSFPWPLNLNQIKEPTGTLTLIYNVATESVTTTDPVTGEAVVEPGGVQEKTVTRPLQFVKKE